MKRTIRRHALFLAGCCLAPLVFPALSQAAEPEEIRIEDGEIEIQPEDSGGGSILIDEGQGEAAGVEILPETGEAALEEDTTAAGGWSLAVPVLHLEAGRFAGGSDADRQGYGRLDVRADRFPGPWQVRLEARLDGYHQSGERSWDEASLDYGEIFVRRSLGAWRFTLGTQTIIWGRLDEIPLADRLSRVDARRALLDDLPDRRRALPALRVERFLGEDKLDLVVLPYFQPAELPDADAVWYPVRRASGEVLGIDLPASLRALIRAAGIEEDAPEGFHGAGLRYTHVRGSLDVGLTLARTRQSLPYFRLDLPGNRLVAEYPRSTLAGFDLGFDSGRAVWRWELAWISDVPVTRTSGAFDRVAGLQWGGAVEFHPGDGDLRVNLQLVGRHLLDAGAVYDRKRSYNFNGSLALPFAQAQWRLDVRWFADLDRRNLYVNPKLVYLGWEPGELYLAWHGFDGNPGSLGGFYRDQDLITLGWRTSF